MHVPLPLIIPLEHPMHTPRPRTRARALRGAKLVAVVSAVAVAGVGVTLSLAAWTDTEWITTGTDSGGPVVSTSAFEVEQHAYPVGGGPAGAFIHAETSPGNVVTFSVEDLAPGVPTYGLVGLRTAPDVNSVGGTLVLQPAIDVLTTGGPTTDTDRLFAATTATVWTWSESDSTPDHTCDATIGTQPGVTLAAATDALGSAAGTAPGQTLLANGGNVQYYCFELEFNLPDPLPAGITQESYMGVGLQPAWEFSATSN
ncbi:acyl-CoA dehydrogenase [Microbacterium album]|uniref:Uncharacterized protein n=1 Tax=Microbacterium album TaxID=2053191 RepID=A0A917MKK6_9MICO|nr:acyl-CoA dehydrogenase [Microbacterium album]GGH36653.1 hypothetical protein GCM10010921_05960 [Microbacterium album]